MSMKKFNKATLAMAVAGALAASSAQAVNIAEDGLGDFIYGPYYSVRNGMNTYLNVHNTSEETVVFKIRFREHYNSREVRDFNVVLSPFDVWTAKLLLNADGDGARLETYDRSCTAPIAIRDQTLVAGLDVNDFVNYAYADDNYDTGPTNLERTTMGYFEIINMGQDAEITDGDNSTDVAADAMHVNGDPGDCATVNDALLGFSKNGVGQFADFDEPENSLKVNVALVNAETGVGFAVNSVTLANFYNPNTNVAGFGQDQTSADNLMAPPGSLLPDASDVFPKTSVIPSNVAGSPVVSTWDGVGHNDADPVSAVLMRASVINQFRVEGVVDTDWVVTMPTKHFYVDDKEPTAPQADVNYLFPEMFGEVEDGKSCVDVEYRIWDREETTSQSPDDVLPSPLPPDVNITTSLCREVNVIRFGEGVLHEDGPTATTHWDEDFNAISVNPYVHGWVRMTVAPDDADTLVTTAFDLVDDQDRVYEGIPMIGFATQEADWNWTYAWDHSYGRSVIDGAVQMGNNPANGQPVDFGAEQPVGYGDLATQSNPDPIMSGAM